MEAIEKRFGRNKETKKVQKTLLKQQYEKFSGTSSESLYQIHDRLQKLISELEILGESLSQEDINMKFLRSLPSEWQTHTLIWRNKADLEDQISAILSVSDASTKAPVSTLLNTDNLSDVVIYSFFASQSNSPQLDNEDLKQIDANDLEEMDLNVPRRPVHDRSKSGEGYHVVPPLYTGTFMPPKPDLVFNDAFTTSKIVPTVINVESSTNKTNKEMSKTLRPDALIIEDWTSYSEDESEHESVSKQKKPSFDPTNDMHVVPIAVLTRSSLVPLNAARPITTTVPQPTMKSPKTFKHVVNKAHSTIKRPINHRLAPKNSNFHQKVTIVKDKKVNVVKRTKGNWGNPQQALKDKGIIDSGCSRYMTGNISYLSEFEEINRGYVAFGGNPKGGKITGKGKIKTGKLDFDNVYFVKDLKFSLFSFSQMCDKKNSVLFKKTECVVLSSDFKLSDENLVLLRVPRENNMYNVNIKNAEAVNTACYVQNRVLVTKPHNKTPYELLLGRTPSVGFMSPFGCPFTILNTLDPLGKLDWKADEGFLVGYSVTSMAFRVFNIRTIIVQETLHINFLENQPNVAGSRPKWLFDIDTLTQSMNYQPVVTGNQPNHNADPQNADADAAFDVKENENKVHVSPSSSDKTKKHDEKAKREAKGNSHVDLSTGVKDLRDEFEEFFVNSTNRVNAANAHVTAGHTQKEGIDYEEVFAPVASIEAIRLFLAYASFMGFMVYQIDVKNAFLYGTIEEKVYICQPLGFEHLDYPHKVYKVVKALYGLHQAPRASYETLANYLWENGFQRGKIDQNLFIKKQKGDILLVQVYVDDIIFRSTNKELCKAFLKLMKDKFQMSSIGELTFFLGLHVKQKDDRIIISQDKYVAEILRKFSFTDGKSASTPIDTEKPLLKAPDGEDVDVHIYRSMIDSLMYLTSSKPDIMFAVCACARFQVTPKLSHLHVVKRIFRYLKGKPNLGLWYHKDYPFNLVAYSDSDYAGASLDRKSTIGGCQFLGCRLISWQCKKQIVVATSSTEAEYVAAASCCAQFWAMTSVKRVNDVVNLQVLIDRKKVIVTEDIIRQALRFDDANGVECLPTKEIFAELARMGYEKPPPKLTFYKAMIRNVDSPSKFLMYPRFLQVLINNQVYDLSSHITKYTSPTLTHKVFANMRRIRKGFSGVETSLFDTMLVQPQANAENEDDNEGWRIKAIDADEDITLIDAETQSKLVAELQGRLERKDEVNTAAKEANAAEPIVFNDKDVTMTMAQTLIKIKAKKARILDEQMAKRLQDEEIEQATAREKQEKGDFERAKVRPIFEREYNKVQTLFIPYKDVEEPSKKIVAKETLLKESFKKLNAEVEVSVAEFKVEALHVKYPLIDWEISFEGSRTYWKIIRVGGIIQAYQSFKDILKDFDREDLDALWRLVKEKFSTVVPTVDKEKAL
uniref:Putative ribonuclease H-like domain-containing protein n=1 Tax=Tanacetum cinerariifolium TaxID=118510 RepID=A0A6L2JJ71_TANCI|nr:putative ribonuclease H-like domain-containing protein [Tanacetum cinerariifolium]